MYTNNYSLDPASLLVALVNDVIEAEELARSWKLSNVERKLCVFVAQERSNCYSNVPLKYYQDMLVEGVTLSHILEVLKYCGRIDDTNILMEWKVPVFPLNGKHLFANGITNGPHIGQILRATKDSWKQSFYLLTLDELIEMALKYKQ